MSEETTLNHKTFDLGAVLAGQDRPETTVDVYFNEKLGFTINKLRSAIQEQDRLGNEDAATELQKELSGLVEKVAQSKYTVHLRGIDEGVRKNILKKVREEFPEQRDFMGRPMDNLEGDEVYTRRLWTAMITKVVDPEGAISYMTEELAKDLQDKAPKSAQGAINQAINELDEGGAEGFEFAAREAAFLSIASPEG